MTSRLRLHRALLLCSLALAATQSFAQAPTTRSEARNQFDLGVWVARHKDTLLAQPLFSGATAPDTLSLENDLGLKRNNTAYTLGYTRLIGQAWHFNAEYTRSSRRASTTTARRLQIGDVTIPSGSVLRSDTNLIHASFAGGVALVQRDDTEFGVRMGGVSVRTRLDINDAAGRVPFDGIVGDVLPMVGLFVHTRPSENWRFSARLDLAGRSGGRSTQLQLALRWQPTRHLGLDAGLRVLNGRSSRDDFVIFPEGREYATYRLSGPQLSAHIAF